MSRVQSSEGRWKLPFAENNHAFPEEWPVSGIADVLNG